MFHKTKCELLPLTPELALRVCTLPGLPGERGLKPSRVKFFQKHIEDRTYYDRTWTIVVDTKTGNEYRADGQHSSYALREIGEKDFPVGRVVTIETIETDDIGGDAASIFLSFDNAKGVRSNTDIMGIHRAHYPDLVHVEREFLKALANGIFIAESMLEGVKYAPGDRGLYWKDETLRQFAVWAWGHRDQPGHAIFKQMGIVGAMVAHWRADVGHCQGYWAPILAAGDDSKVYNEMMPKQPAKKDLQGKAYRVAERYWKKAYDQATAKPKQLAGDLLAIA